ncbi:somatostatin receptor type 2-like isoform X2 [Brevipalpus obovatus]|uniref:somatostatin receptor type 2-like isoform X2 n=1 Tax=Brevipalpus obovatus TaxID=246614 RepID=UPI003D9DED32
MTNPRIDYPIDDLGNPITDGNYSSYHGYPFNFTDPSMYIPLNETMYGNNHNNLHVIIFQEVLKILYSIVCLVGLCGNSMVIYVVLRFSKMQTVTNIYLFNLALADEMFLGAVPYMVITMNEGYWVYSELHCRLYLVFQAVNQYTSSLLVTVMSADRYVAVCHPISSPRYRTPFVAKLICMTVWTVSALLMLPVLLYARTTDQRGTTTCVVTFPENVFYDMSGAFTVYTMVLGFFVPFTLIMLFYCLVVCKLRHVGPKNKSKEKKRSHRKVTYLVLTVITVYLACWLPNWIGQLYITFIKGDAYVPHLHRTLLLLASLFMYVNSALNPILYAFLSDNFKKSFVKAFTCAAASSSSNGRPGFFGTGFRKPGTRSTMGAGGTGGDGGKNGDTQTFINMITDEHNGDEGCGGATTAITDLGDNSESEDEDEEAAEEAMITTPMGKKSATDHHHQQHHHSLTQQQHPHHRRNNLREKHEMKAIPYNPSHLSHHNQPSNSLNNNANLKTITDQGPIVQTDQTGGVMIQQQ